MKTVLDQKRIYRLDKENMSEILLDYHNQITKGREFALSVSFPKEYRRVKKIFFTGLGGSAIGGEMIKSYLEFVEPVPFFITRTYDIPAVVDDKTLAFVASYSGNTEETLEAYTHLKKRGAKIVAITSDGKLAKRASGDKVPVIRLPEGYPPRTTTGYVMAATLTVLEMLRIIPSREDEIKEAYKIASELVAAFSPSNPTFYNLAKRIALTIHGTIPLIYASCEGFGAVAYRWKIFINENAKQFAFCNVYPELDHNEIVGWEAPKRMTKKFTVIQLRDRHDHFRIQKRFEITADLIRDKASSVVEVWSEGEGLLARTVSLWYVGDFVSYYLALLNKVDPTAIKVIDALKRELAQIP